MKHTATPEVQPRLLGLEDAGRYVGLSYWAMRGLTETGAIPRVVVPGIRRILVDRTDLDRLIEAWKDRG